MQSYFRASLVCCFLLLPASIFAAQPPAAPAKPAAAAVKPGPKNAEFNRLLDQWKTFLGDLRTLQVQYHSADAKQRAQLETKWNQLIEKGPAMEQQLLAAAQQAYTESPNTNKEVTDLLVAVFAERMERDEYEGAADVGKLLADNKCPDRRVANMAGLAALAVNDLATAEKYLNLAEITRMAAANKENVLVNLALRFLDNPARNKAEWEKEQQIRAAEAKADDLPRVLLKTNRGDIELELFENEAPNSVANFITLVQKGFYDGLTFHRVLPGFMAQGGDPQGDGLGGPGYNIACECYQPNHRLHFRGSLSMAHSPQRDTNGSQFFLTFVPTSHLDGVHTVFGRVVKGMDVLAKLQRRDPTKAGQPAPDKIIEAKVLRKRQHEYTVKKMG